MVYSCRAPKTWGICFSLQRQPKTAHTKVCQGLPLSFLLSFLPILSFTSRVKDRSFRRNSGTLSFPNQDVRGQRGRKLKNVPGPNRGHREHCCGTAIGRVVLNLEAGLRFRIQIRDPLHGRDWTDGGGINPAKPA